MPRPYQAPDDDDGAAALQNPMGVPMVEEVPPPPIPGILGNKKIRLTVLSREETLVSFAPGTRTEFLDSETVSVANTIHTAATTGGRSLAPRHLLDLESGRSVVVSSSPAPQPNRQSDAHGDAILVATRRVAPMSKEDEDFFEEQTRILRDALSGSSPSNLMSAKSDLLCNTEVGPLGSAWRTMLRYIMLCTFDKVNALQLSRALQLQLFFQTSYEAYITAQLIRALDTGKRSSVHKALKLAFRNRNVSRLVLQTINPRYDWIWHTSTAISWNRVFDAIGLLPIIGITAFPATENFPSTRNHALASIFRVVLGQGNWITRVVTGGREGLVTDGPNIAAQNLGAESNGFELANRNQYGTYIGRLKTNEFRCYHRLPTDESLLRTFVDQPAATTVNNGVWHVIRQVAKHWRNTLNEPWGNFAHQRMEQLDPFETLRFHMPVVLSTLASLRGRNRWDSRNLAPMIARLQVLEPQHDTEKARQLIRELKAEYVGPVCGGIHSLMKPFEDWLDAMHEACLRMEEQAVKIFELVATVELGIRLGYDIISNVNWKVPSDRILKAAIRDHILQRGRRNDVPQERIESALLLTTPRDKRTLIELLTKGLGKTKPAQLLLSRVKTLLQRELRRHKLNQAIRSASVGDPLRGKELVRDDWYWLKEPDREASVYIYAGRKRHRRDDHMFLHVNSGYERMVHLSDRQVEISTYIPVAEAISRAKRVLMNIELEYGRTFKYSAFMEFNFIRLQLRRLLVVSQMSCEVLDDARLNVLREVQRSNQAEVQPGELEKGKTYFEYDTNTDEYLPFVCQRLCEPGDPEWALLQRKKIVKAPPQSLLVIGGGPTGLMTAIHCTENVLASGGEIKLYEARDAFDKGGSTFERAQIVRLDARWIEMMRYHLGTTFEDIFTPASGETDSQLGNTL